MAHELGVNATPYTIFLANARTRKYTLFIGCICVYVLYRVAYDPRLCATPLKVNGVASVAKKVICHKLVPFATPSL